MTSPLAAISNKLDKALILLLRATQPGELQAAQAAVLRLAENQGLDAHGFVEQLMKGGGDKKYSDTEMLEIKKQAIQQGRDLEKMARGVDPDEVDWVRPGAEDAREPSQV